MQRKEGKKDGSKGKGGLSDPSQQQIYQAIVIATCDEDEFRSHDSSSPVCLQEVAGATILDYVLKSLNSPRIKEIIVMSGKHKQQLQTHLAQYTPDKFPKRVEFMYTEGKNSIGAYLHEIESQKKVQECFVLVHASLITNANIEDVLDDFESKMELDNNIVMLRVFAKGSTLSEQRTTRTGEYVMLDNQQRIMKIANVTGNHVKLQVCKINVLKNYHENFDYTNERQYLDGLLASEVLAETVFLHELPRDRYGINVLNPQLLLRANLDALRGYIENLMNFDPNSIGKYKERFLQANEPNSFYSPTVQMDYDCQLGINSIIMENSKLGSQSRFSDCILGANCSVGAKTQVHLSLLSQDVQVGSNCTLRNCYIGKGVRIHDDCRLINCRIEQNAVIDQGAKIEGLIIKSGKERAPFTGTAAFRKSLLEDDDELDFNEPEKVLAVTIDPAVKLASFTEKVREFIFKGDEEGDEVRKISKDVSNLKLDMNIEYSAWISATTRATFDLIRAKTLQVPASNKPKKWDEIIDTWKPMWEAFQTEASRIEILKAICESWAEERIYTGLNAVVLAYKHDIVSKDSVISWFENRLDEAFKPKFQAFYETLLKQESDSDDDSDEDDSGDSDSKSSS